MNTLFKERIKLGKNEDDEVVYLAAPSWDYDTYWGFGYIQNKNTHYHFDGLMKNTNLKDGIVRHFKDFIIKDEADIWLFCELMATYYTLKKSVEVLGRGGSNYTFNPCNELIKNKSECERINTIVLPAIFDEIYKVLVKNK